MVEGEVGWVEGCVQLLCSSGVYREGEGRDEQRGLASEGGKQSRGKAALGRRSSKGLGRAGRNTNGRVEVFGRSAESGDGGEGGILADLDEYVFWQICERGGGLIDGGHMGGSRTGSRSASL
jgi:hypothetical protein